MCECDSWDTSLHQESNLSVPNTVEIRNSFRPLIATLASILPKPFLKLACVLCVILRDWLSESSGISNPSALPTGQSQKAENTIDLRWSGQHLQGRREGRPRDPESSCHSHVLTMLTSSSAHVCLFTPNPSPRPRTASAGQCGVHVQIVVVLNTKSLELEMFGSQKHGLSHGLLTFITDHCPTVLRSPGRDVNTPN